MRRRSDIIDQLLERWASWRITEELYSGTGPSALVRFREPASTRVNGSRLLYFGRRCQNMAALNGDLVSQLGHWQVNVLLMLYGLPGDDSRKVRQFGVNLDDVRRLRKNARDIARHHIHFHCRSGATKTKKEQPVMASVVKSEI